MLNDLIFCLNATLPIFFLVLLGIFLKRIGFLDDTFVSLMNSLVFRVCLPALLFHDMCGTDYRKNWDTEYVLYCFIVTLLSILLCIFLSYFLCRRSEQGEFIQTSYRSSATILGIAVVQNLYSNVGMAPLMIIGAVPLYNIAAVVILAFFKPERTPLNAAMFKKTIRGILTNPIILSVAAGFVWSLLRLPMPALASSTIDYVGRCATPLGIIAMGASFSLERSLSSAKAAGFSTFIKLFLLAAIFLPIGVHLGFRNDKLVAALVMCGSSSTISCFVMAKEMGHAGDLTTSTVMLTTLLSAFSLTFWLFLMRTHGLI